MRAVAIINGNARRLRGKARKQFERALPGEVRFTSSLDQAREVIRAEIARGRDLIVLGGGDGTVVMGLTLVAEACRGLAKPEPAIGVLRLGTGNAIADAVGATDDPADDLARLARGEGTWQPTPMLEVLGFRTPFVGMGIDALVLEDHEATSRVVDRFPGAKRLIGSGARYTLSVGLRSIPRFATVDRSIATVTNLGSPGIEMGKQGVTGREIPRDKMLWTGPCTLVAASTIPYFGFGLKMFAFAGSHAGRFHLRCGSPGVLEVLRNVPRAFKGTYFSDHIQDFLCDRVEIELDPESPVEVGGELVGRRRRIEVALTAPVNLASLANHPR
ncbi:MAG: diacylglycerol kinase family protein [Kofleriaceae bacterium]